MKPFFSVSCTLDVTKIWPNSVFLFSFHDLVPSDWDVKRTLVRMDKGTACFADVRKKTKDIEKKKF